MHDVKGGRAGSSPAWRVRQFANAEERSAFAALARECFAISEINHDIEWLEAGRKTDGDDAIVTLTDESGGQLSGLLPLRVSTSQVKYTIGDRTLLKAKVREFQLFGAPLTVRAGSEDAMARALDALADTLPADGVVFAGAVALESPFHALLTGESGAVGRRFHVLKWGAENLHCKIAWEGTVEAYLASLGADSRRNFKRYSKKLFANAELKPSIERFRTEEEVTRFLDDGVKISEKTYQKKLYGLGLARGGTLEKRFRFAAAREGFLGHILYLDGQPAAFHYGFVNGDTFFVVQMGYDPAFSSHQPGAVLFFHVLEDVEKLKLAVKTVDCLPGVTDFKLRTTNRKERIQNFYLFKRGMRGTTLYYSIKVIDSLVAAAKAVAGRLQVAGRLRAWLSQRKA